MCLAVAKHAVLPYFLSFWGLSWRESRVSFLSLGVKKKKTFIFVTILETVIHQSAQPSNKHMDESASCF